MWGLFCASKRASLWTARTAQSPKILAGQVQLDPVHLAQVAPSELIVDHPRFRGGLVFEVHLARLNGDAMLTADLIAVMAVHNDPGLPPHSQGLATALLENGGLERRALLRPQGWDELPKRALDSRHAVRRHLAS